MRVMLFILFVVITVAAVIGWMMVAHFHTEKEEILFRDKNLQDMCDDLIKENRQLSNTIHRLGSLSEDTDKIIAKCLEILIGLGCIESEQQKPINSFYVGNFNKLDKQKIWNFFQKFSNASTDKNSMWWSHYAKDAEHLSKASDNVSTEDAAFICFEGKHND